MRLALLCLALAATAHAQTKPIGPMRVSGGVMAGSILTRVAPVYPPEAKAQGLSGIVVLHAIIGKDGSISSLQLVSGADIFAQAAWDAVKQWTYRPYLLNGQPTEVDTTITVNFKMSPDPASTPGSQPDQASAVAAPPSPGDSLRVHLEPAQMKDMATHKVPPVYPIAAKRAHISGSVLLHGIIGTDGHVVSLTVISGPAELQQSALDAVYQWTYKPYLVDGVAREIDTTITMNYVFGN